ncbi:MAG: hypothetical protein PUJ51_20630 [Clostridiales bacterium]|nr:hypothetical protein [Clostridiales bacterium]
MNETRKVILNSLEALMKEMPEQRVGQIIFNYICSNCPNNDPFFISDKDLLKILEKTLDKYSH